MYTRDFTRESLKELYVIALVLMVVGMFVLWSFRCIFTGKCYLTYDSNITELGVCLDTEYHPIMSISQATEDLYLCGVIDGVTPRRGSVYLFDKDGKSISVDSIFHHDLGIFYHPLTRAKEFQPGRYRVEIWYLQSGRRTKVQTEFEVIPQ